MKNVLLVLSSPRGDKSYSHRIANQVIDEIRTDHPDVHVVVRDLVKNPLPLGTRKRRDHSSRI